MQKEDEGLRECLAQCRLLAFDVDGTLTDSIKPLTRMPLKALLA